MSNELEISIATIEDLVGLNILYQHLHPDEAGVSIEIGRRVFAALKRLEGSAVFVGKLGDQVVSSVTLIVIPNLTRNGRPYALIENVVTSEDCRSRGFAGQILRHAVATAWRCRCYKVMLLTGAKDRSVLRFYENIGFEQNKTGFQMRDVPVRIT
jgi:GNAT superfamily N-acetyltransferase